MTRTMSNIPSTEYEIHFAAEMNSFTSGLHSELLNRGFRDDGLSGHGVVFSPDDPNSRVSCPLTGLHVTWDSFKRESYITQLAEFERVLSKHSELCVGYAHAEVIRPAWDLSIEYQAFDESVPFPVEPFQSEQSTCAKRWDIHISAIVPTLDKGLQKVLVYYAHMYYIDLRRQDGTIKRVFTIQGTNSRREGIKLFKALLSYLAQAGGMSGSIKFEQTCYWKTCGNPTIVPPVIHAFSFRKT